jgi:secernin
LFGKNSDRSVGEVQLVESHPSRSAGPTLRTQYLTIPDAGSHALVGSRPSWLWGFEHGVNDHRVAIGNERVFTTLDPTSEPDALIGMDLVRLALERADTAEHAVDVLTDLLARHGQGGVADETTGEPYFSSFLIADPSSAWVVETSGRSWAAKPADDGGATISNRLALADDWSRASADVLVGARFDDRLDPASWPAASDRRLECTRPAVTGTARIDDPRDLAALLRHHGTRPWGRPGDDPTDVEPLPPTKLGPNAEGFSVCMHVLGRMVTAASMICELPTDPDEAERAWVALGSPCASIYVPVFPPFAVPAAFADAATWRRFDRLRARVERDGTQLAAIRAVLAPLEAELWDHADELCRDPRMARQSDRAAFVETAWTRVDDALKMIGA